MSSGKFIKKTKYGDYERVFTFDVFGKAVYVIIADDIEEVYKDRHPKGTTDFSNTRAITLTSAAGHRQIMLRMEDIYLPYEMAGIVAHESFHAVRGIMLHLGMVLDNEVFAYHLGWLVEKITKFAEKVRHAESNAPRVPTKNATLTKKKG